jgi:hypothetical protein
LVVFDPPHTFAGPNGRTAAARVAAKMYGENAFTLKRYGRSSTWIATSNKQVRRVEAAPGETT